MNNAEKSWSWYAGSSEELFEEGPFATRQEAIDAGFDNLCNDGEDGFYICEAVAGSLRTDIFDGDQVAEIIEDRNEDARVDDSVIEQLEVAELNELVTELNKAVKAWADKHNIHRHVWTFAGRRSFARVHRNHNPGAEE